MNQSPLLNPSRHESPIEPLYVLYSVSASPSQGNLIQLISQKLWNGMTQAGQVTKNIASRGFEQIKLLNKWVFKHFKSEQNEWGELAPAKNRYILPGLAVSIISSVAAAYLLGSVSLTTAALYGTINYGLLTGILEQIKDKNLCNSKDGFKVFPFIIGASYAITHLFLKFVCKAPLNYQTSALLTLATLSGQAARVVVAYRNKHS